MPPVDTVLRAWWPTTQSLDLVEAPIETAAIAVQAEFTRFAKAPINVDRRHFDDLGDAFAATPDFANVVTHILLLPTRSKWTVLRYNSFLCDGYDSLCGA